MAGLGLGLGVAEFLDNSRDPYLVLDLNYAGLKSLGTRESFSRASSGTYFNASGVLTSAGIDAARFNHVFNGTSWVSKGLLVEEQRTNLLQYSEQFDNGYWLKVRHVLTANALTAPDGTTSAEKLATATGQTSGGTIYRTGISVAIGTSYTISVFAKKGELNYLILASGNAIGGGAGFNTWFDLNAGTIGTKQHSFYQIKNVGNGWYLCSVGGVTTSTSLEVYMNVGATDGSFSVTGDGTSGIYLWGAQTEAGAFPTSYIPTTSASTTRSADVCQITGGNFSGFYNQNEGSVVLEFDGAQPLPSPSPRNFPSYLTISKGNSGYDLETNSFSIFGNSDTNKIGAYASIDRVTQYEIYSTGLFSPNMTQRSSFGYAVNNFGFTNNGENVLTDTSGTNPNQMAYLHLGKSSGGTFSCHIARLRYYNARLTNARLQELST